jgi:hypothetical protein
MPQQQFKGYSQDQMKRIASKLGHTGDLNTFNNYLDSNPKALGKYNSLKDAAVKRYARGGMVKSGYDVGGDVQKLFKQHLGRAAGSEGANYYATKYQTMLDANIDSATAMSVIGGELQNSTEGKQRAAAVAAGNTDFQRYVAPSAQVATGVNYNTTTESTDALGRTGDNTAADTAAIQQIYQNQLGRAAETGGADYYADLMAGGTNLDSIRETIRGSKEAGRYGRTGTQTFVPENDRVTGVEYRNPLGSTIKDSNAANAAADANAAAANAANAANAAAAKAAADAKAVADAKAAADAAAAAGGAAGGAAVDTSVTPRVPSLLEKDAIARRLAPELVAGSKTIGTATTTNTNQLMDTTTGQVNAVNPTATSGQASTFTAGAPTKLSTNTASNVAAAPSITANLAGVNAAQGNVGINAQVDAAQQIGSSVTGLSAAQEGTVTQINGAPTRNVQGGEIVNAVADSQQAAAFTEQIKAAQADPSSRATVQGQLATLMTSFDNGNTPAWAAGAMRNVTAQMASRGIGSSSMAGQALIQAALESALPIANADAQTYAQFDLTNLNNKQQRAMLSAQQRATFIGQEFDQEFQERVFNSTRIGEIANMNFTATQAIAIENAQLANSVKLSNLSNRQGVVMAEAAALSQIDISNLNNRQQEQVQNAKSFLDMDMANLTNLQQMTLFKAQERNNALLSDAAASNASEQFNATSKNQTDQFFSNLQSNVKQFNATQKNSQEQFNTGQTTAVSKFNAEIRNQREQFNSQNSLVINQSNAQWRRQIATADTVANNRVNEINAKALLDISNTAYNNLWQEHRDEMDWTYKVADSENERYNAIVRATIAAEAQIEAAGAESDSSLWSSLGTLVGTIAGEYIKKAV